MGTSILLCRPGWLQALPAVALTLQVINGEKLTFTFFTLPLVMVDKVLEMRRGVRPRKRPLFPSTSTMCLAGWDNTRLLSVRKGTMHGEHPKNSSRVQLKPLQAQLSTTATPRPHSR